MLPNYPQRGRALLPSPEPAFPADIVEPKGFDDAIRGMRDRAFLASQNWQDQQWRANREGANPYILEFERVFIKRMAKLGVPMFAHEVVRTAERQDDLYAQGVTKAKAGQSAHQYGCAVDIVHSVKGWGLSNKEWALCFHVGTEVRKALGIALEWGGDDPDINDAFDWDPAHWELDTWKIWKDQFPWT